LLSHGIGVRSAPPKLSSEPSPFCGGPAGLPHDIIDGSAPPFDRTAAALEGSGTAGGKGKVWAPDVTCTTRSTAWRYELRVL